MIAASTPGPAAPQRRHSCSGPDGLAPVGAAGAPDAGLSPQRGEAPAADTARGFGGIAQTVSQQSTAPTAALRKALETLRAKLALRGYELHELADGSLMVSRWNLSRPLSSIEAAEAFARQVGAA